MISPFAGTVEPNGWLFCNGQAVDRIVYSRLFEEIGEVYGAGDGSTTFNIPDLRGRLVVGANNGTDVPNGLHPNIYNITTGTGFRERTHGEYDGAEIHTVTLPELPTHNHPAWVGGVGGFGTTNNGPTTTTGNHDHSSIFNKIVPSDNGGGGSGIDDTIVTLTPSGLHNHSFTTGPTGGTNPSSGDTPVDIGANAPHNNMMPYRVINYMIKF